MSLFGGDESEVSWLRSQVKFLQEQLVMIADQAAIARLTPKAERKDPTGKPRGSWRHLEDRPTGTEHELAAEGAETSARAAQSFDPRQP